ncbi:putative phosphodiesterase [Variovorax boronicumulans]|uniref:hypothetical protein n=1 Tax=Variovorax boronicumulans TaxID=436515 RepID=UPI002780F793|nr:hypothetical protein [Variovorax boronicumulans]MDQ0083774.1 putative phosphodiesterase [Variovorax boronicumulans]
MKLLILSDLHTEFETFEVAKELDYDVAVLAGDMVAPRPRRSRDRRDALHGSHAVDRPSPAD